MAAAARARLIPVAEIRSSDADAWRELAGEAAEPNPFFEPQFVVPAVENLAGAGDAVLVVTEDADGWIACLPAIVGLWRAGLPAVQGLRTKYTYLSTPLVRSGRGKDAALALIGAARDLTGERLLVLEHIRGDGDFGTALAGGIEDGALTEALNMSSERALLCRRDDGAYFDWMSRKRHRELRRQRARLEEASASTVITHDISTDAAAPAIFLALEMAGWKGREGTAMACDDDDARFFTQICQNFRAEGRLEMLAMRAGDDIIAMVCNLRSGKGSFSLKVAHDEKYSKFSPGKQLEIANARYFHESGNAWMDSCAEPDNEMMNRLWPERRQMRTTVIAPADLRGRITRSALGAAAELRRRWRRS